MPPLCGIVVKGAAGIGGRGTNRWRSSGSSWTGRVKEKEDLIKRTARGKEKAMGTRPPYGEMVELGDTLGIDLVRVHDAVCDQVRTKERPLVFEAVSLLLLGVRNMAGNHGAETVRVMVKGGALKAYVGLGPKANPCKSLCDCSTVKPYTCNGARARKLIGGAGPVQPPWGWAPEAGAVLARGSHFWIGSCAIAVAPGHKS